MTRNTLSFLFGAVLVTAITILFPANGQLMRQRRDIPFPHGITHHAPNVVVAPSNENRRNAGVPVHLANRGRRHPLQKRGKAGCESSFAPHELESRSDASDKRKSQYNHVAKHEDDRGHQAHAGEHAAHGSGSLGSDASAADQDGSISKPAASDLDARSSEAYNDPHQVRSASAGCTFSSYSQLSAEKLSRCPSVIIANMAVPAGKTLDLSGLPSGTTVTFSGETTFGHALWKGPLILVSGTNLHITGAPGSILNGGGSRWWDGLGDKGSEKPKFFAAHKMENSMISFLTLKDSPVQAFSINEAKKLAISHVKVDSSSGNAGGKARNTDAFDVGSSDGVTISNAWVHNQDDCLAINSGTNIVFEHGTCIGGHGLSIGSVGNRGDNKVQGVRVANSHVADSDHAIRIKTIAGATGSVSDILYESITMSGIRQDGIVIEQDYLDGGPTGRPTGGVPITGLTLSNISGDVQPGANSKNIKCANGSCKGWKVNAVQILGGKVGACSGCPLSELCSASSNVVQRSNNGVIDRSTNSDAYGSINDSDASDTFHSANIDDSDSPSSPAFLGGGRKV